MITRLLHGRPGAAVTATAGNTWNRAVTTDAGSGGAARDNVIEGRTQACDANDWVLSNQRRLHVRFSSGTSRRGLFFHPDSASGFYGSEPYPFDLDAVERRDGSAIALELLLRELGHPPDASRRDVLDLGCGHGRHAGPLSQAGFCVTGVDLSERCLRRASERYPLLSLVRADAAALPMADQSFDIIMSLYSSLGLHGADPSAALREAARVARPGAMLIADVARDGARFSTFVERLPAGMGLGVRWRARDSVQQRTLVVSRRGVSVYALSRQRLSRRLHALAGDTGWIPIAAWGDWDGRPWTSGAPRLVLQARRDGS